MLPLTLRQRRYILELKSQIWPSDSLLNISMTVGVIAGCQLLLTQGVLSAMLQSPPCPAAFYAVHFTRWPPPYPYRDLSSDPMR